MEPFNLTEIISSETARCEPLLITDVVVRDTVQRGGPLLGSKIISVKLLIDGIRLDTHGMLSSSSIQNEKSSRHILYQPKPREFPLPKLKLGDMYLPLSFIQLYMFVILLSTIFGCFGAVSLLFDSFIGIISLYDYVSLGLCYSVFMSFGMF